MNQHFLYTLFLFDHFPYGYFNRPSINSRSSIQLIPRSRKLIFPYAQIHTRIKHNLFFLQRCGELTRKSGMRIVIFHSHKFFCFFD